MMESLLGGLGVSSGFDSTRRVVLERALAFLVFVVGEVRR